MKECIVAHGCWFYLLERQPFLCYWQLFVCRFCFMSVRSWLFNQPSLTNQVQKVWNYFFHHHLIQQDPRPAAGLDGLNMTNHTSCLFSFLLSQLFFQTGQFAVDSHFSFGKLKHNLKTASCFTRVVVVWYWNDLKLKRDKTAKTEEICKWRRYCFTAQCISPFLPHRLVSVAPHLPWFPPPLRLPMQQSCLQSQDCLAF